MQKTHKKLTMIIIALIMLISLLLILSVTVSAAMILSLNKKGYDPGETITAIVNGVTDNPNNEICIFLCNPDDPIDKNIDYWWVRGTGSPYRTFPAPKIEGKYEVRLFANGNKPSDNTFIMKIEFTVANTTSDIILNLNKTAFDLGEDIIASASEVTQVDLDKEPVFTLCKPGDAHGKYIDYWWIRGTGSPNQTFPAPEEAGNYEVRLYSNGNSITAASFVMKISITVGNVSPIPDGTTASDPTESTELSELSNAKNNIIIMKINDPDMTVNGAKQEIDPGRSTTPQIIDSRTLVPIRAVIEAMGGTIDWDDATKKITLNANGHSVIMWLNIKDIIADGERKTMDVEPVSINGRTMVPIRFAAENIGCAVDWIAETEEVIIMF